MIYSSKNDTLSVDEGSDFLKLIIISIYGCLSFGIFFNLIVAGMIMYIFHKLKDGLTDKHMLIYILALSFVDGLVLGNLPLIIVDIVKDEWIFGNLLCKLHWTTDSVNKILSTFILTTLSFDRYLAVCHPYRLTSWRSVKTTVIVLISCTIFSISLLSPCYLHAEIRNVKISGINLTLTKCSYRWNERNDMLFVYSLFMMGYCIPFILMAFFHWNILKKLQHNHERLQRTRRRSINVAQNVGRRMLFVIIFYFVCWTPYWLLTFYIQHNQGQNEDENKWGPPVFLAVHFLVYANSAINPLIYGVCNLEFRRQRIKALAKRRRSSAIEYIDTEF